MKSFLLAFHSTYWGRGGGGGPHFHKRIENKDAGVSIIL